MNADYRQDNRAREIKLKEAMAGRQCATNPPPLRELRDSPEPSDAAMVQIAEQLHGWLCQLAEEQSTLRQRLFADCERDDHEAIMPGGLLNILADACTRAANLLGGLRSISARVG